MFDIQLIASIGEPDVTPANLLEMPVDFRLQRIHGVMFTDRD